MRSDDLGVGLFVDGVR